MCYIRCSCADASFNYINFAENGDYIMMMANGEWRMEEFGGGGDLIYHPYCKLDLGTVEYWIKNKIS